MAVLRLALFTLLSATALLGCEDDIAGLTGPAAGALDGSVDGGDVDAGPDAGPYQNPDGGRDGGDTDGGPWSACPNVCFKANELVDGGDAGPYFAAVGCQLGCPQGFACTGTAQSVGFAFSSRYSVCEPVTEPGPSEMAFDLPPPIAPMNKVQVEIKFGPRASSFKDIQLLLTPYGAGEPAFLHLTGGVPSTSVSLAPDVYLVSGSFELPDNRRVSRSGELTVVAPGSVGIYPRLSELGAMVTFNALSIDGTPISSLQSGESVSLSLQGPEKLSLSFIPNSPASIAALLEEGTYQLTVHTWAGRFLSGRALMPPLVVEGASATVPLSLQTARLSGTVKFDGVSTGRSGQLYAYDRETNRVIPIAYQDGAFQASVYPGTYDILLKEPSYDSRAVKRAIGDSPVLENVVVPAAGKTVNLNLTSRTYTLAVRLNGQPLPNATGLRGAIVIGREVFGLGTTGPFSLQRTSYAPESDIVIRAEPGGPLPSVPAYYYYGQVAPRAGETVVIDLKTAQLTLEAQWNGAVAADSSQRRGAFTLRQLDSPFDTTQNQTQVVTLEAPLTGPLKVVTTLYAGRWQTTFVPRTTPDLYSGLPMPLDFGAITLGTQAVSKVVSQQGRDVTLRLTQGGMPLQSNRGTPVIYAPVTPVGPGQVRFRIVDDVPFSVYFRCSVSNDPFCGAYAYRGFWNAIRY